MTGFNQRNAGIPTLAGGMIRIGDKYVTPYYSGNVLMSLGSDNPIPFVAGKSLVSFQNKVGFKSDISTGTSILAGIVNDFGYINSVQSGGSILEIGILNHVHNRFSTKSGGNNYIAGIDNHVEYNLAVDQAVGVKSWVSADSTVVGTIPEIIALYGIAQTGHFASYNRAIAVQGYVTGAAGGTVNTALVAAFEAKVEQGGDSGTTVNEIRGLSLANWSNSIGIPVVPLISAIYIDDTIKRNATVHYAIKSDSTSPSQLAGDVEITDTTKGIILKSPNGTRYRIKVDNAGVLSTAAA